MANPTVEFRLDEKALTYLEDLVGTKLYGKDKSDVIRRLLDALIREAIKEGHILRRS